MKCRILTTLLIAVIASTFSVAARAGEKKNPATTPSPRMIPDPNWIKRHQGFVAIAKEGNVDVLFLGDSITDAWRNPKGGKELFMKHFEPLKAANFGIGGDRTEHVLWRIQNGELDGIQPKVVMLMIGTNNTFANSAQEIAEGVTAIVKTIHKKSPDTKVLLLAVFPRASLKTGERVKKIDEINAIIKKLDNGKSVKYLDIGERFLVNGQMSKEIMYDYLHLTPRGYEIWTEAVAPVIREMMK